MKISFKEVAIIFSMAFCLSSFLLIGILSIYHSGQIEIRIDTLDKQLKIISKQMIENQKQFRNLINEVKNKKEFNIQTKQNKVTVIIKN